MFAAGRKQQEEQQRRDAAGADADDWLQVGASFVQEPRRDKSKETAAESSALQLYRKSDRKSKKKAKKSKSGGSDSSRKAARRRSHKRPRRRESDSSDCSSSPNASDDDDRDGEHIVRCKERHLKKKEKKSKKKKKSSSSSGRRHSDSSGSDSDATIRRRSHRHSHKRLRASEHHTEKYNQLVATAPKEVQVWMKQQTAVDDMDTNGSKLFEFDCAGDRENRFYGTLYAQDKPLYALATRRNVFTGEWLVERKQSNGVSGRLEDAKKAEEAGSKHRYFGVSARQMEKDSRQRRLYLAYSEKRLARQQQQQQIKSGSGSTAGTSELGYIPLDPVIHDPSLKEDDNVEDRDQEQLLRTETANIEQYLVTRSKIFNESLQKNPRDIDTWLDFVAFQEQSLRLTRRKTNSNSQTPAMVVDKQVAILEKAIQVNPGNRELQLVKLNLSIRNLSFGSNNTGATAVVKGDQETLRSRLEEMIERDPTNGDLWSHLLRTRQQNFASFSVPLLRDLYARIIAILRKETSKEVAQEEEKIKSRSSNTSHGSSSTSSSVQIFDSGSLLASSSSSSFSVSFDSVVANSEKAQGLVDLLLDFHSRMCALEQKAGYAERAIAQLQALIDFNLTSSSSTFGNGGGDSSSEHRHANMVRDFTARWSQSLPHFGDEVRDSASATTFSLKDAYLPSSSAFARLINERIATQLSLMNPSGSIQSREHRQSLLMLAGTHHRTRGNLRRLNSKGEENDGDKMNADGSDDDESLDGDLTYSNVHGYRIQLDEIDDASEYERILSELRGTESSIARQESQIKKHEKQKMKTAASMAKLQDERADYGAMDAHDVFVEWLKHEETKEATQWIPLRSTNPLHLDLIDEAPDRAVLTEEIQPFLFRVPRTLRLAMVLNLLKFAGVHWSNNSAHQQTTTSENTYTDDFDEYEELVKPILSAMDPESSESILLSPSQRRDLLQHELLDAARVSKTALIDPSKVAFIRNVLTRFLDIVHNEGDRESVRRVKCLWIEFEAQIVASLGAGEEEEGKDSVGLQFARQLCQQLMENESTQGASRPPSADVALMFAYAKLEQKAGHARQVNRICDKTIQSLDLCFASDAKMDRSFHTLIFLRARNEAWTVRTPKAEDSTTSTKPNYDGELRKLKTLYVLWSVWQDQRQRDWGSFDKLEKRFRKQPRKLKERLDKMVNTVEVKTALVEKYRVELEIASQQYTKESNSSGGIGMISKQSDWLWSVGYCVHNLCLAIYATSGLQASCNEYQSLIQEWESSSAHQRMSRHQTHWLRLCYLDLLQQHQLSCAFPIVASRDWRHAIGSAVERFPHDPGLLRLYVDAETSNTMSQSLRRHFQSVRTRWQRHFDSPLVVEWLFALLCEFSRLERSVSNASWQIGEVESSSSSSEPSSGGSTCCLLHKFGSNLTGVDRVRRIFQDMVESVRTQGSALCWRLYVRFEVQMGKIDTARRVFYRGLAKCPWSKALYLDGIRVLRPYLSGDECKELVEFMAAKELHVREGED